MNRPLFFDSIRPMFGSLSAKQVGGIETLLDAWEEYGTLDLRHLAYIFATVHHETGKMMVPVRECFAKSDVSARHCVRRRRYGKSVGPFSHVYYGRGRVQNTWHANYRKLTERFGIDFEQFPDKLLANRPDARVTIIGHMEGIWTTKRLSDYIKGDKCDYRNARRIVNGRDKARKIAKYARKYEKALLLAEDKPMEPIPIRPPVEIKCA